MVAKYFFVLCLLVCIVEAQAQYVVFNVMNYGAKSDGQTDNSGVINLPYSLIPSLIMFFIFIFSLMS